MIYNDIIIIMPLVFYEDYSVGNFDNTEEINNIDKVRKIDYSNVNYEIININNFRNLKELYLDNTAMKQILNQLFEITNLEVLYLRNNHISNLSDNISKLKKLRILNLEDNKIEKLEDSICDLESLEELYINYNKLKDVNPQIKKLKKLKKLRLDDNMLSKLPDEICYLESLKVIYVYNNKLVRIPTNIGKLTKLEEIYIYNNQIIEIPASIGELSNLRIMDISNNEITTIPNSISKLTNLQELDFSDNMVAKLPLEIIQCHRLLYINYRNNPLDLHPLIRNFINRIKNYKNHNIYHDNQNVHNSSIQDSVKKSIFNILHDDCKLTKSELVQQIIDSNLDNKQEILNYLDDDTVHSVINITYYDLLVRVWNRIMKHNDKVELIKILDSELENSKCKCFTGRFTRLVNTLSGGYYNDITIGISDNCQISNIILNIINKISDNNISDNNINNEEIAINIKREATKTLLDLGYSMEKIEPWIDNI